MKSRIFIRSIAATIVLTLISFSVKAQSTGYINRIATSSTGRAILNPNSDNYTSATSAGFMGNDVTNSEISYRSVPSFTAEPFGDLRRGPNHLYSDFVPDANNVGYYMYYDNTNLLFRFRMGSVMPGSKGYSVLLDTDGKFGASGANADPDFKPATTGTNGNPGFEIEIVLETNKRIAIYNVAGSSTATLEKEYLNWQDMSQVSIAGTFDNGDPDFFIDFYIPFSDLQAAPFNLTTSSTLRMIATTVMSPQAAIGGPKSDIYGLSDGGYKSTNDEYEAYINAQAPFTPSAGPSSAMCTAPPVLNGPINTGATSVSGTWTKSALTGAVNTATVKVYINGVFTTGTSINVTSGNSWTISGLGALPANAVITAKAVATGESECLSSNAVVVSSCNSSTIPATPILQCLSGNKGTQTSGATFPSGYTVNVQNLTAGTAAESATYAGSGGTTIGNFDFTGTGAGPFSWKWQSGCGGSPVPQGQYKIWYSNSSGCVSEPVYYCAPGTGGGAWGSTTVSITNPGVSASPAQDITTATNVISGTATAASTLRLYVDKQLVQSQTLGSGVSSFSFNVSNLTAGQTIYLVDELNASSCASATSSYSVKCLTSAPIINADNNNQIAAASAITGTSGEAAGTTIRIYTSSNALAATTTVQANGTWSTANAGSSPANYTAVSSTVYYAIATNGTCGASTASGNVTAVATTAGRCGSIDSPITTSDPSISGTIVSSATETATVNLYLDGQKIGSTPVAINTNSWNINTNTLTYPIYNNGVLTIGIQETGKQEQVCPSSVTVSCNTGPATPTFTPSGSSSVSSGQSKTYTVTNAQTGAFYGIADATTGQSLGSGVWATSSTVALTTNSNLSSGSYTVAIKGTSLNGVSVCSSSLSTASLLVSSILPATLLDFYGKKLENATELTWIVEQEVNVKLYEIERSNDGTSFVKIGTRTASATSGKISYQFGDMQASLPAYYRLKILDQDGKYSYSKIIVVQNDFSVSLSARPNPFVSKIQISTTSEENQLADVELVNLNGQVVKAIRIELKKGANSATISTETLKAGIYLLRLKTKGFVLQEKLLKAK